MNKHLDSLQELAKAYNVTRMDNSKVDMSSPASVSQAKRATRIRAQKIRSNSPKQVKKATTPAFDMDKFNKENPVMGDDSHFKPLTVANKRMQGPKSKRVPGADEQADKMKSVGAKGKKPKMVISTKKSAPPPARPFNKNEYHTMKIESEATMYGKKPEGSKKTKTTSSDWDNPMHKSELTLIVPLVKSEYIDKHYSGKPCTGCNTPLSSKNADIHSTGYGERYHGGPLCKNCRHDYGTDDMHEAGMAAHRG
jgi:hypothetical protein